MKLLNTFSKCGLLVAFLMLLGNAALAQRAVKGKVTDAESGEPLIGATVSVVGTTRGTSTDVDGNYSIEVPAGSTQLRCAYTGYAEQVVALDDASDGIHEGAPADAGDVAFGSHDGFGSVQPDALLEGGGRLLDQIAGAGDGLLQHRAL